MDMDIEQAFSVFECTPALTSSMRLRAARILAQSATSTDRSRLQRIRAVEHNTWVQRALDQALNRAEMCSSVASDASVDESEDEHFDEHTYEEIRAKAIEETSKMFLHELRPLIGILDKVANDEIKHYSCSRTKKSVSHIRSFFAAVKKLADASAASTIKEFNLTDLVVRAATDEVNQGRAIIEQVPEGAIDGTSENGDAERAPLETKIKLKLAHRSQVITTGDPSLISLAVANALRNAIEAVSEVQREDEGGVTLNWGATDIDNWVAILDEGCGLPQGWDRLTALGVSTKKKNRDNLGMGLTIAERAMQSVRGSFQLTPRSALGVSCTIRWPN